MISMRSIRLPNSDHTQMCLTERISWYLGLHAHDNYNWNEHTESVYKNFWNMMLYFFKLHHKMVCVIKAYYSVSPKNGTGTKFILFWQQYTQYTRNAWIIVLCQHEINAADFFANGENVKTENQRYHQTPTNDQSFTPVPILFCFLRTNVECVRF